MTEVSSDNYSNFDTEMVTKTTKEVIESVIGGNTYQLSKVNSWSNTIAEHILTQLMKNNKPFKYIVSAFIVQKNGAGLHTATSCYWDSTSDGHCNVRWENKSMHCIVQVFGIAL